MTQGQSIHTQFKEKRFTRIIEQSLLISKAESVKDFPYFHIDCNSGGGYNKEVGVDGSPVNFFKAVDLTGRSNIWAMFIDEKRELTEELTKRLEPWADQIGIRARIICGDNSTILRIADRLIMSLEKNPKYAMGSIVLDPNGYHAGIPWPELIWFSEKYRRFDLIFNLNVRVFLLERAQVERVGKLSMRAAGLWASKQIYPPSSFLKLFHRNHCMITDPNQQIEIAGSRWMQVVCRSMKTAETGYRKQGFYDINSATGRQIINRLENGIDAGKVNQLSLLPEL